MEKIEIVKAYDFLSGGGEMAELIRNLDWRHNPLGDPANWENSLRTCVRIMLSSTQPIWIGWGKQLIKLYNDAYIDIVRGKHPHALGQPASVVWKDIWKDIEPMLAKAMIEDEGTYKESQLLIMERSGYPEETYYTFSYTPVLGDNGKPAGIICYNVADTARIINERSLSTLEQLDTLAQKKTEAEVYEQACKALGTNTRDFPFAVIYKIENDGSTAIPVAWAGIDKDHPQLPSVVDIQNPLPGTKNFVSAVRENKIIQTENDGQWTDLPLGAWDVVPNRFIHVPIKATHKKYPLAILTIGLNPYRQFDDSYKNLVQSIADRISLGVNNVIAYEEERKRAEVLAELDKAKTIFFSNISHEFRTPLTLMLGTIEETLNDSTTHPRNLERMVMTHRNAIRLLKLVNTLLDFSRIESGRQKGNYIPIDFISCTKNLASNFRSVIEKAGLEFIVHGNEIEQQVYLDRSMWEKIVFNLLSNAFKYTLAGSIRVNLFADKNYAVLEVADTGVGIPGNELPRMFERFHRIQNVTGRTYEGTGIGLSLTKELVQLHGGTIAVESRQGEGSVFKVMIPFGTEHLPAEQIDGPTSIFDEIISDIYIGEANSLLESDRPDEGDAKTEGKATVLIVDDNADMRLHLQAILHRHFNVIAANNGLDALHKIRVEKPALIVSDIMMPIMDGIQLLKEIKGNKETERIPVVLLTARAGEESKIEGYETGADDYLVKPFSATELLSRIKAQLDLAQKRSRVETQLKEFLMQAPAAIAVLEGPSHTITIANGEFQKLTGRTEKQLLDHRVKEVFPELEGQAIISLLDEVFLSGKSVSQNGFPATLVMGGEAKPGFYDFILQPIRSGNEEITGIMVHAVNVTERMEARKKIEESEIRFRTMANEAPLFVWLTNENLQTVFLNRAGRKYFNLDDSVEPSEISWKNYIHADDLDMVIGVMKEAGDKQQPYTLEMRLKNGATGEYRWFLDKGIGRYENEKLVGFIGTSLDIHDRKEAETQIRQNEAELKVKDQQKDDFILMASHELKTPVTTINGYVQLLMEVNASLKTGTIQDTTVFDSGLKTIHKQIAKLTSLISELLDLSRIQKGQLELHKTVLDLSELVSDVVNDVQYTTRHKIELTVEAKNKVHADKDRIMQVVLNFITNAVKYSPDANKIEMRVFTDQNNCAAVSVKDYGIGIDKADHEKIFERFYRAEGKKEKTFPGFGIGLFIASDIIKRHEGVIRVESEKNKGSEFTFILPIAEE